ncbi:MAG: hypothetical protein RL040_1251, partial [Bacteroidota bacterium]
MIVRIVLFSVLLIACSNPGTQRLTDSEARVRIPSSFPEISYPEDNAPTALRIE